VTRSQRSPVRREAPGIVRDPGASLVLPGRFRAAVFDMDGLLLDTEPLWVVAEAELLARHGHVHTAEDAAATHGRSIADSVAVYAERLDGADPATLEAELLELMRAHYAASPPLRPGVRGLLAGLRGRLPLAVASSTSGWLVRTALGGTGLLDAFPVVVSGHDLGRPKPAPDVYLAACAALGVDPGDAVAFEDSPMGVRAALDAGMFVVGVPERTDVDLATAGAHVVLRSLAEVVVEG
jgi:HAD superfamily hydrolase (TIGR01509 family)